MVALLLLSCLPIPAKKPKIPTQQAGSAPVVEQQPWQRSSRPIDMILDADFGSSTDDLFALMMLHHYIDEGKVDVKGIIVDREGENNAGVVDIFNTYYGHPNIPIGLERNGVKNPRCFIPYAGICDMKDAQGKPLFQRTQDVSRCPDGYKLYRQLLSKAEDKSIVVVAIGFATTLAQLFESGADEYSDLQGVELFGRKVRAVYVQAGRFEAADSLSGYNMRAASKQAKLFYDGLPKNVDIIFSPSNVGDRMDYLPQDVMADLSTTILNPIKTVYAYYTCDTGQRMWDTNCLVNAVQGDYVYNLSERGWVEFIDRGHESLMRFTPDPQGNARYQLPGESYFNADKLMEIRRHNRISRYPSPYTIEMPQPIRLDDDATEWVEQRLTQLCDKYMATAGKRLDPNEVLEVLRPIGYSGNNLMQYKDACDILVDTLLTKMLDRAANFSQTDFLIITGPAASGKTTVAKRLNLKNVGLLYDASLTSENQLAEVIARAKNKGMQNITLMVLYNDLMTCFSNSVKRGLTTWSFYGLRYVYDSFVACRGKLAAIHRMHPDLKIIPVDYSTNTYKEVSIAEAEQWQYAVSDDEMNEVLQYLDQQMDSGTFDVYLLPGIVEGITDIPMSKQNLQLARTITQKAHRIYQDACTR